MMRMHVYTFGSGRFVCVCRGRNFVDKFETSSRHDSRRGDRRIQIREGRGRRAARRTSRKQEEEGIFDLGSG